MSEFPFEYRHEPDSGIFVMSGEEWVGVRVKYRAPGVRRWQKFIIVDEGWHASDPEIRAAIEAHAKQKAVVG